MGVGNSIARMLSCFIFLAVIAGQCLAINNKFLLETVDGKKYVAGIGTNKPVVYHPGTAVEEHGDDYMDDYALCEGSSQCNCDSDESRRRLKRQINGCCFCGGQNTHQWKSYKHYRGGKSSSSGSSSSSKSKHSSKSKSSHSRGKSSHRKGKSSHSHSKSSRSSKSKSSSSESNSSRKRKSKWSSHSKSKSGSMSFEMNRGLKGIEEEIINKNPVNRIPEEGIEEEMNRGLKGIEEEIIKKNPVNRIPEGGEAGEQGKKAYDDDAYYQSLLKSLAENENIFENLNEGSGIQEYEAQTNLDFDDNNEVLAALNKDINKKAGDETPPEQGNNAVGTNTANEIPTENEESVKNNVEYETPVGNGNEGADEYEIPEVIENGGNNEEYDTSKENSAREANKKVSKPNNKEENENAYNYYEETPKAGESSSESSSTKEKKSISGSY